VKDYDVWYLEYIISWLVPEGLVQPGRKESRSSPCLLSIPCMHACPLLRNEQLVKITATNSR
jgi:hypothetical protein